MGDDLHAQDSAARNPPSVRRHHTAGAVYHAYTGVNEKSRAIGDFAGEITGATRGLTPITVSA
jgi:hypothetical protein